MIGSKRLLNIATYSFFVLAYIEDTLPFGQVFTFITLALMLIAAFKQKGNTITFPMSGFLLYIAVMLIFCAISALWAEDPSLTSTPTRGLLMKLIFFSIVLACHFRLTQTDTFLKTIMYGGYTVVIYAMIRYGWSTIMYVLSNDLRLSTATLMNGNSLGMCAAYSIVINIYYMLYKRLQISDLLIVPSIIIIAASGSRKSIIIVIMGTILLLLIRSYNKERLIKNLFKGFLGIVAAVVLIYGLSKLSIFSNIVNRFNALTVVSRTYRGIQATDIREVYNMIGWDLFKSHPILGIGIYNASLYISQFFGHPHLHNNFIELLACGGIVGFIIHYSFYFYLFVSFFKLRKQRTNEYDICIVLLVIRFIMGYGYIQFFDTSTYFYLMIFYLFVKNAPGFRQVISEENEA